MTELDRALVRRKLATIVENLADLEPFRSVGIDAYRQDRLRRKAVERLFQELVEAAVDANLHLLRVRGRTVPSDYYSSFIAVGDAGILARDLAARLAPAAGLRNRLVHEYDEIDDAIVLQAVTTALKDFTDYVRAIEEHLNAAE